MRRTAAASTSTKLQERKKGRAGPLRSFLPSTPVELRLPCSVVMR